MNSFTVSLQSHSRIDFPFDLPIIAVPLLFLVLGVFFSVMYIALRKTIGATLVSFGVLELLPFLLLLAGLNDVTYLISFLPLVIVFVEGCITLFVGVFLLHLGKTGTIKALTDA
ncbi:MAG: hypothetical protein NWF06_05165 [Candidatus Bathyarchaeota archaeon]|nr:hypothetical protein [Candidatus Bathyarchaeum sp.]